MTFGAWIKTSSASGFIMAKDDSQTTSRAYDFGVSTGKLYAEIYKSDAEATNVTSTGMTVNDNNWHFVNMIYTFVANGTSTVTFYVDGRQDYTVSNVVGPIQNVVSAFSVGARTYTGSFNFFSGSIDEPFVTAEALTPSAN